jgi:hypothetical protein
MPRAPESQIEEIRKKRIATDPRIVDVMYSRSANAVYGVDKDGKVVRVLTNKDPAYRAAITWAARKYKIKVHDISPLTTGQRFARGFTNDDIRFVKEMHRKGSITDWGIDPESGKLMVTNKEGLTGPIDEPGFTRKDIAEIVPYIPGVVAGGVGYAAGGWPLAAGAALLAEGGRQGVGATSGQVELGSPESNREFVLAGASEAVPLAALPRGLVRTATQRLPRSFANILQGTARIGDSPSRGVEGVELLQQEARDMIPPLRIPGTARRPRVLQAFGKFIEKPELHQAAELIEEGLEALKKRPLESGAKKRMLRRNSDMVQDFVPYIRDFLEVPIKSRGKARTEVQGLIADILETRPVYSRLPVNQRTAAVTKKAAEIVRDDASRDLFFSRLTPMEADKARATIMAVGYETSTTQGGRIPDALVAKGRTVGHDMSQSIRRSMKVRNESETIGATTHTFDGIMDAIEDQERTISILGSRFGGLRQPESMGRAVNAIRGLKSQDMVPMKEAIDKLDAMYPHMNIKRNTELAWRTQFFTGAKGVPDPNPRMAMTGDVMGGQLIGGFTGLRGVGSDILAALTMSQSGVTRTFAAADDINRMTTRPLNQLMEAMSRPPRDLGMTRRVGQGITSSAAAQTTARHPYGIKGGLAMGGIGETDRRQVSVDKDGKIITDPTTQKTSRVLILTPEEEISLKKMQGIE